MTARSVERALFVLETLASASTPSRLSDLARKTALSKATAHRMLAALVARGFAGRVGESYTVGPRLRQLDIGGERARQLQRLLMPFLMELYDRTRAAVSVGVLVQGLVYYSHPLHDHRYRPAMNQAMPPQRTAAGMLLLAFDPSFAADPTPQVLANLSPAFGDVDALACELAAIRSRRLAYAPEPRTAGEVEIAAPVVKGPQQVVAAITLFGRTDMFDSAAAAMHISRAARAASNYLSRMVSTAADSGTPAGERKLTPSDG